MKRAYILCCIVLCCVGQIVRGAIWPELSDEAGWDMPAQIIPDVVETSPAVAAARLSMARMDVSAAVLDFIPMDLDEHKSIHQIEMDEHRALDWAPMGLPPADIEFTKAAPLVARADSPTKRVVGWHPYWATQADIESYDYSNLTTIAYFSYEVDPSTGNCLNMYSWGTSPVLDWAHSNGVKVVLTATLFGTANNELFLKNASAQSTLIDNLITVVSNRNGDGVCIDFENVGSWTGATKALTTFMSNLTVRFHRDLPGSEVSIALPAVDWYTDFDVAAYERFGLDYAIIMGYDYYYAGSSTPGPVAPLYSSAQWIGANTWCSVDYSIRYYLNKMTNSANLLLGVPYYGRQWRAASSALGAANSGASYSVAKTYLTAKSESTTYGAKWDSNGSVPYYTFTSGGYTYQCFYDDETSLGLKYDLVNTYEMGGIGIWNLTQGRGATELWNLIDEKLLTADGEGETPVDNGGEDNPGETSATAEWVTQTSAHNGYFYGVRSRDGLHVASGAAGAMYSSPDGINWTAAPTDVAGLLMNVNGDGPLWVVVGGDGTILTSEDAASWSQQASPTASLLRGIAYGANIYVACGDGGALLRSVDGENWTSINSGTNISLQGVCYGEIVNPNSTDGQFVLVGERGYTMTSSDGLTWSQQTNALAGYISDVIYGNGYFVAVGPNSAVARSSDGITWTQVSTSGLPNASTYLFRVVYCAGVFKAVGRNGAIWSSPDGLEWVAENSGTDSELRGISYANDQFVAVGASGAILTKGRMASPGTDEPAAYDGFTWATDVTDTSFLLNWGQGERADALYEVQVSSSPSFSEYGSSQVHAHSAASFSASEGWLTNNIGTAVVATNVNGKTWKLYNLEVRPALPHTASGDVGYLYLTLAGSHIISPPFYGTVTQVVTKIRAAGTSNYENRKAKLLHSLNGGETFADVETYGATSNPDILTYTCNMPAGLNGGENGVIFKLDNVSTGAGVSVLLHAFDVLGTVADESAAIPGHSAVYDGLTSGATHYVRLRDTQSDAWSQTLDIPLGIQPKNVSVGVITSNSIAVGWNAVSGAEYLLDVSPMVFSTIVATNPVQTLVLNPSADIAWHYEGTTTTASAGSIRTAPVYYTYDAINVGHFLVGTNNQSLVSAPIATRGATSATLQFTSGAWNALGATETTRVNAYYKLDDGPWCFIGTQTATSTSDGGPVPFSKSLPPGALEGTNLYIKITAPNAWRDANYLRGAYVNTVRVTLSSTGGDYAADTRVPGYPRRIASTQAILQNLEPSTRYDFRIQTILNEAVKSAWVSSSATTAAVETGGENPGDDNPVYTETGLPETVARQPAGALSGVVVYTSGGHGFGRNATETSWTTERGLAYSVNEDMGNLDQLNYFVQDAWKAGATVVPFRPVGHQTNEIVLDNVDTTLSTRGQVTFSGTWHNTGQTTLYYGVVGQVGYRYAYISTTGTTASAIYRPNIPEAGEYPVYTWVRHGSDRVSQLYRIHHSGGIMETRVNHSQVGCGWVWLGNYQFSAGTNGWVEISNDAPGEFDANKVVLADAIRFGNGMGSVAGSSVGISGFEQELESSRFWVIKSMGVGMAASLYDMAGYDDRSDNIGQPARMANHMCRSEGGNRWQRVYVGFHSNAGTGNNRGVWGLYDTRLESVAPTYYRAQTNLAMRIAQRTHSDMTIAAANGVIPSWGASTRIYGSSYGEIYNASIYNKMDTTINEVAFHDNEADCVVLKTPTGREWLARSSTRAIVEHLSGHYSASTIPVAFAPDRPISLQSMNTGENAVSIVWKMPARTAASGDMPTGFIVHTSTDGMAFGNPIHVAGADARRLTLTNLTAGASIYFRVCATNAGGESLNSAVAGVRVAVAGKAADVLVVDGFKRNDAFLTPTRYLGYNLGGNVAMVRPHMINAFDYIKEHGTALAAAGRSFDYADADTVTASMLAGYEKVVWILGEEGTADQTFSAAEQTAVSAYLNQGGRLFVSGSEIGYDLGRSASAAASKTFLTNLLRTTYQADNSNTNQVTGTSTGILNGVSLQFNITNWAASTYTVGYPDVLGASSGATVAAVYGTSAGGSNGAIIQYSNDTYRVVVMGFPFETITTPSQRTLLMTRVMEFFDDDGEEPPPSAGALCVTLTPPEAVAAGAQWQLDGGAWQNSAVTLTNLTPGAYSVAFKMVEGYTTPLSQIVTIASAQTNSITAEYILIPNYDGDGNGLPDWWELEYFGSTGVDPNEDGDGDGFTNYEEYIALTDPTDKGDYLVITAMSPTEGIPTSWTPRWEPERQYTIQGLENMLLTNWGVISTNSRFFRVIVELPE